jgi:hypothetical protein
MVPWQLLLCLFVPVLSCPVNSCTFIGLQGSGGWAWHMHVTLGTSMPGCKGLAHRLMWGCKAPAPGLGLCGCSRVCETGHGVEGCVCLNPNSPLALVVVALGSWAVCSGVGVCAASVVESLCLCVLFLGCAQALYILLLHGPPLVWFGLAATRECGFLPCCLLRQGIVKGGKPF